MRGWGPTKFSEDRRSKGIQTNALHWRWNWTKRHCHHGLENVSRSSGSSYSYDRTNVHCHHCLTKEQPLPTPTTSWLLAIRTPAAFVMCVIWAMRNSWLTCDYINIYPNETDWSYQDSCCLCHVSYGSRKRLVNISIHLYLPKSDWLAVCWSISHGVCNDSDPPKAISELHFDAHRTRTVAVPGRIRLN